MKRAVALEKAEAIRRLHFDFGLTYKHIFKLIPISQSVFYNILERVGAYK